MGHPVPKGSSLMPNDAAKLGLPDVLPAFCVSCGRPASDAHHDPPRSRIPRALHELIPRYRLCGHGNADTGSCHGLAHGNGGHLAFTTEQFIVMDQRAADRVNERRRQSGWPAVEAYRPFALSENDRYYRYDT